MNQIEYNPKTLVYPLLYWERRVFDFFFNAYNPDEGGKQEALTRTRMILGALAPRQLGMQPVYADITQTGYKITAKSEDKGLCVILIFDRCHKLLKAQTLVHKDHALFGKILED